MVFINSSNTKKHKNIQIAKTHEKKLSNLTHKVLPFTLADVITNLSLHKISYEEVNIVKYGLGNSIPPERLNRTNVFVNFDLIHCYLTEELKSRDDESSLRSNLSDLANSYYSNYKPTRAVLKKQGILKKVRNNKDIVILRSDKGNGVVIMDKITYKSKVFELLNDESKFKQLTSDPTKLREGQLQCYLRKLNNKGYFDESVYDYIYPAGSLPSKLYGTTKIHNIKEKSDIPPLRPIVSSINSYNYNLASYLCELLTPFIPSAHCTKDSFTFIKDIQEVSTQDSFMVSYDVCSLFTNIPLSETIDIAVKLILENKKDLKFLENELTKLFCFATSQTHFYFDGKIFILVDGIAMGSPLGPALANLFMGYNEQKWLESDHGRLVKFYHKYVDNIFCLFENKHQALTFLDFLNSQHPNLNFTIEKEHMKQLPFLDVLSTRSNRLIISTYRQSTFTGLLQNYNSFVPYTYKKGLIKTLIDRTFHLNNTWDGFHLDLEQ